MSIIHSVYDYSTCWQMSPAERTALLHLMSLLPEKEMAIEVGTYCGGSLKHIANSFKKTISLDLTHEHVKQSDYPNTQFITGDSRRTLPALEIPEETSLILIDGNHEYPFVLADLHNVTYQFIPKYESVILLHDSWYDQTRNAILDTKLGANPYIHFVDLDFCSGTWCGSHWVGGFCLIHLQPFPRIDPLEVRQSDILTYRKVKGG